MGVHAAPNQKVNTIFDELGDVLFWNVEQAEFIFGRIIHHLTFSVTNDLSFPVVPSNDELLTRGTFFMLPCYEFGEHVFEGFQGKVDARLVAF